MNLNKNFKLSKENIYKLNNSNFNKNIKYNYYNINIKLYNTNY